MRQKYRIMQYEKQVAIAAVKDQQPSIPQNRSPCR